MTTMEPIANGRRLVRDAIVMSGWNWETFNVPERVALALAHLGARVLYCENPVSRFHDGRRPIAEIEHNIYKLTPEFLGHRLNRFSPVLERLQAAMIAKQVLRAASELSLRHPLFIYPHGEFFVPLASEFKRRQFLLVHICMDYPEPYQGALIEMSDMTLLIPKSLYEELRQRYGHKICLIPQVTRLAEAKEDATASRKDEIGEIRGPKLGYAGPADGRLNLTVLEQVLTAHPKWQFFHFGKSKCLPLANVHALAWQRQEGLKRIISGLDVGLMPYRCEDDKNLHCMPLKLFDYFALGKAVVSTPILNLFEYSDTIYFGNDADQISHAIQMALDEPADSPLRAKRMAIAERNSIETLADVLDTMLVSCEKSANAVRI